MNSEVSEDPDQVDGPEVMYEVCDTDQAHPQWTEIREGVNYVAAWREGRRAALQLRSALSRAGLQSRTGFARARSDGSAVVCIELEQSAADALAELIGEALRERRSSERKVGSTPHVA